MAEAPASADMDIEDGVVVAAAADNDEEEAELTEAERAVGVERVEQIGRILDKWERHHIHVSYYGNHSGRGAALSTRVYADLRNTRDGARLFNWTVVAKLLENPHIITVTTYYESTAAKGSAAGDLVDAPPPRLTRNTGGVSSYALKHVAEKLLGQYVANGDLIIARALLDMPMQFTLKGERLVNPLCF